MFAAVDLSQRRPARPEYDIDVVVRFLAELIWETIAVSEDSAESLEPAALHRSAPGEGVRIGGIMSMRGAIGNDVGAVRHHRYGLVESDFPPAARSGSVRDRCRGELGSIGRPQCRAVGAGVMGTLVEAHGDDDSVAGRRELCADLDGTIVGIIENCRHL